MNVIVRPPTPDDLRRRAALYALLDAMCRHLEPTQTQLDRACSAYEAVAAWIAGSTDPLLASTLVYLHGSGGAGTTIRPIGRRDFDIDLICLLLGVPRDTDPAAVKAALGRRLREHALYASMLQEKKRCWRLDYAGEFHLDVSPTITNILCPNGGELIPDTSLTAWHPTNPRGLRELLRRRADLQPTIIGRLGKTNQWADAEPFPASLTLGHMLHRIVQLLKRHRDQYFLGRGADIAPISIIITALAMRAYEHCVTRQVFEDELAVLIETIRTMPLFIERPVINGRPGHAVWNETTQGENFADCWNTEPARARAFFKWHGRALGDFEALRDAVGLDVVRDRLSGAFGEDVVAKVMDRRGEDMGAARRTGSLLVAPALGLTTEPVSAAVPVRPNTFFGD